MSLEGYSAFRFLMTHVQFLLSLFVYLAKDLNHFELVDMLLFGNSSTMSTKQYYCPRFVLHSAKQKEYTAYNLVLYY